MSKSSSIACSLFVFPVLMMSSCTEVMKRENLVAFCDLGTEKKEAQIYFDLEKRVAFADDLSSSLGPLHKGDYVGFIFPFPIMVPSEDLLRTGERLEWEVDGDSQWEADRYSFVSEPEERPKPAWFLITATQKNDPDVKQMKTTHNTTVLYSLDAGVVSIRRTTNSPNLNFVDELYLCSQQKLNPLELDNRTS